MADLSIAVNGVAAITAPTGSQIATTTASGVAGAVIAPGQVLYADPSAGNQLKLAQATNQFQAANVAGIALGSAGAGQPISYAVAGDIQIQTTSGSATLASGSVYVLGVTAPGDLVALGDANAPAAGNFMTVVGIGNGTAHGSTSVLRLSLIPAAVRL